VRVIVCEDDLLVRDGLVRLLRDAGEEVCAEVRGGDELLAAIARHRPELAIVDARVAPALEATWPPTAVLMLAPDVMAASAPASVAGFLRKDRALDVPAFLAATRIVAAGGSVLDPDLGGDSFGDV
jgi:DNA-binding NarL/FixJ family response regulator